MYLSTLSYTGFIIKIVHDVFVKIVVQHIHYLILFKLSTMYELSLVRECPQKPPGTVSESRRDVQNIDILSFWKTFYDRHCALYKWNFAVFGIE